MDIFLLDLLLRWAHFAGALVWIGHNYATAITRPRYLPLAASDLADPGSPRQRDLLAREHGTFRYASLLTLGTGLAMLGLRGTLPGALGLQGGLAYCGQRADLPKNVRFLLFADQGNGAGYIINPDAVRQAVLAKNLMPEIAHFNADVRPQRPAPLPPVATASRRRPARCRRR